MVQCKHPPSRRHLSVYCSYGKYFFSHQQVYNTTFIRWTTHNPRGLSDKDIDMATTCDFLGKHFGEVDADKASCDLSALADQAAASAGDCCTPKK